MEKPQLAGIPILVLGNKRDLPNALDENGLIERMNLNAVQDREICCYSVSCKEKDNIDITLQWLISHSKSGGSGGGGPPGTSASVRNGQWFYQRYKGIYFILFIYQWIVTFVMGNLKYSNDFSLDVRRILG